MHPFHPMARGPGLLDQRFGESWLQAERGGPLRPFRAQCIGDRRTAAKVLFERAP